MASLLREFDDDKIVSATLLPHGKPAPDVYIEALKRVGCTDARRAIIIEDAVNGLKAAKGAGAYVVAVTNTLPAAVVAPFAEKVVASVADLDLATLTWPSDSQLQ